MRSLLALLLSAVLASAQTASVSGKLVVDSSAIAKKLYGSRLPVLHATTNLKNNGPSIVSIGGSDINLALSTIPTVPSSEGNALVTQAYAKQTPERVAGIITMISMGIGLASGVGTGLVLSAKVLGYLLFGIGFGNQALLPFLESGQPALPTFNPCDQLNISLAAGQSINCDVWVEKPSRKSSLPSVVTFDLEAVPPSAPLPPAPPVVQLRRRVS